MASRLAVLGSPIAHSHSPALHRAAYRALGLDWHYEAVEVAAGELAPFVAGLDRSWRGLSLTMPLKQEVLPLVDDLDQVARLTGAVNTVLLGEADGRRRLSGFNTDVTGIVRALTEAGLPRADRVSVLGAGATASSAVVAAAELGAESVELVVRRPAAAIGLVDLGRQLGLLMTVTASADLDQPGPGTDVLISTLPGGTVLGREFPPALREHAVLLDVAYAPWPSALAASWTAAGGAVVSGLGMLLHQALIQVRIFVAGDPFQPLDDEEGVLAEMRAALPGAQSADSHSDDAQSADAQSES